MGNKISNGIKDLIPSYVKELNLNISFIHFFFFFFLLQHALTSPFNKIATLLCIVFIMICYIIHI